MQQQSTKQQWIVLGATVLTLGLGAGFSYFQAMHKTQVWPLAVLLGLVWGTIGIWIIWRARRSGDSNTKK
ncbi:MAG TPA: hypothetical protein VNT99_01615 [Methylomirabilota bacterium]|nr:hypothetical protein [Methylomirabilota bacterium]